MLPFYAQMVLTYFRTPRVNRRGLAGGHGERPVHGRDAATPTGRVGGHAAIRSAVLEDVRLAQGFRRAGLPMRVAWAPELIATRMYRDRHEMFEGLLKNVHGTRFSAVRQVGFLAGLVGFFLLPLGRASARRCRGVASARRRRGGSSTSPSSASTSRFARGFRCDPAYGLLFPLAVGFYLVLVATSLVRGMARRPIAWKGREYPLET